MPHIEKLGFNAFWWSDLKSDESTRQCMQTLRRIGYHAAELKVDSFNGVTEWEQDFKRAERLAREEGLIVSNFVILRGTCLEDEATRRRNISDIIQAIRAAAACGIPLLNLTSGGTTTTRVINADDWFRPAIEDTQAAWDRFTASLEMLLPEAERHGVTLALEPCVGNLVHDYGTTLEMLRRVDHPNLCLTFDPSHFMLFRNDIPLAVSTFGNRVRHVHLKDAVGRLGEISKEFIFPLLGEGGIDFPTFLAALDAIGYQGFYSVEFESFKFMNDVLGNDPARAAELSHMAASAILARARA